MDLGGSFNRFYNTIKTSTALPQEITAAETIQKLCESLGNAPLLDDRRAALLGLKGLSRDWKAEVGQATIPLLLTVLETDAQEDAEMGKTVLETLNVLCEVEESTTKSRDVPPGSRNTDRFLSTEKPFHALLSLLNQSHFYVRYFGLQLFATLLTNRPEVVQRYTLAAPGGVGRLVEILDDSRELVRNEGLLLLISLSPSNADIQKLIAFEGAFDRLFDIIYKEGGVAAGNVVVQDCLTAIVSLLRFNVSNQNFFRETSSINQIAPLLLFPPANQVDDHSLAEFSIQFWPEQKVENVNLVITLVRMLVSGAGEGKKTNQKTLLATSVTRCLIELSLASNAPSQIKSNALLALADIMKDSPPNQELFTNLQISPLIPSFYDSEHYPPDAEVHWERAQPVSAILALVAMVIEGDPGLGSNATTPIGLPPRAAAAALFESYVTNLPDIRVEILNTMAPVSQQGSGENYAPPPQTAGTLLLSGLRNLPSSSASPFDSHGPLLSCLLLCQLLRNTESCKRIAREITLSASHEGIQPPDPDNEGDGIGLVSIIVGNLMLAQREYGTPTGQTMGDDWSRIMVGYVILLCVWLFESPKTIKEFLDEGTNLEVIVRPILQSTGVDTLVQGLCAILLGIVYEYNREPGSITRENLHHFLRTRVDTDQFTSRIQRLRDDRRFKATGPDVLELYDDGSGHILEDGLWFDWPCVEFLKNNYLVAQRAILLEPDATESSRISMDDTEIVGLIASLKSSVASLTKEQVSLKQKLSTTEAEKDKETQEKQRLSEELVTITNKLATLESERESNEKSSSADLEKYTQEIETLKSDKTGLQNLVQEEKDLNKNLSEELEKVKQELKTARESSTRSLDENDDNEDDGRKQEQDEEIKKLRTELEQVKVKETEAQKEQEDLLVLLEELSIKRKAYKAKMREAKMEVSEDEDEDDDDE